ncbi:hypothetical protein ACFPFX_24065 [Streptomyces mauvecolor]|uniref:Uncharacterized protein n=1 Tax=Streptomyces mauvecolor TaxID=58345 RepID=A0ABV9UUS1_9ACTN
MRDPLGGAGPHRRRSPTPPRRLHAAEYAAQVLDRDDPAWQEATEDIQAAHRTARESLA